MKSKDLECNYKTFLKHWRDSGLWESRESSCDLADALPKYDKWLEERKESLRKKNKKNSSKAKLLPPDFEAFMQILIKDMAMVGKGLERPAVRSIIKNCLKEYKISTRRSAYCDKTLERFFKAYDLQCKGVKNIDPQRISQVTQDNRTMMFANLDSLVEMVNAIDPTNCPWKRWEDVPARNKYNMDEMSTDTTKHRGKIVIPRWIKQRLMASTTVGKVNVLSYFCCCCIFCVLLTLPFALNKVIKCIHTSLCLSFLEQMGYTLMWAKILMVHQCQSLSIPTHLQVQSQGVLDNKELICMMMMKID